MMVNSVVDPSNPPDPLTLKPQVLYAPHKGQQANSIFFSCLGIAASASSGLAFRPLGSKPFGRLSGHGSWDKAPGCQHYYVGCTGNYALYKGSVQRLPEPPQKPAVLRC